MSDRRRRHNDRYQNPMAAITEQWAMAMSAWTGAWMMFVPGACPPPQWNSPPCDVSTIAVKVFASQPIEVTASLSESADCYDLRADALVATDASGATIDADKIGIKQIDGDIRITVSLEKPIDPKTYKGAIRDKADGFRVGTLTVLVPG
jgi:hypothetical protein